MVVVRVALLGGHPVILEETVAKRVGSRYPRTRRGGGARIRAAPLHAPRPTTANHNQLIDGESADFHQPARTKIVWITASGLSGNSEEVPKPELPAVKKVV